MIKTNALLFGSLIVATIFGVFGQNIAYFMNENIVKTAPIYYLTGLTITSVILYIFPIICILLTFKKRGIKEETTIIYLVLISSVGVLTSFWSLFVLAMWWG